MRRAAKLDDRLILIGALVLMTMLAAVSFTLAPVASPGTRASSMSSRSDGAKAAVLMLRTLGYRVEASFDPLAAMQVDPARTIIVLASPSPSRSPSNQDRRALRQFVERGGIVLATGVFSGFLPDLTAAPVAMFDFAPAESHPYRAAVSRVSPRSTAKERIEITPEVKELSAGDSYLPLYVSDDSAGAGSGANNANNANNANVNASAGVLTRKLGAGRIVWWVGSTPLLNRGIEDSGHLELLLNSLGAPGNRTILWDEYYHGYGRGFVSYLAGTPLVAVFAQLALMGLLALFTFARRRAPIRAIGVEARASAMEFVEAMAALYQKARASTGAVETARARLRRLLIASAQLPARSDDDRLAAAIASRHPAVDARELRDLLAESATAADAKPDDLAGGAALTLVQRLHAIEASVAPRMPRRD